MDNARKGFTLIEVMISVVIISVVILALLEMFANNTHIFSTLTQKSKINSYVSLFIANPDYGLEDKKISLDDLVSDFTLESDLRRKLKETKAEIIYQELDTIDMREYEEEDSTEISENENAGTESGFIFEIGKSSIKINDSSASLLRIKIQ